MIEPLTIIMLALVGLCLVVMWGYIHRVRLRLDILQREINAINTSLAIRGML